MRGDRLPALAVPGRPAPLARFTWKNPAQSRGFEHRGAFCEAASTALDQRRGCVMTTHIHIPDLIADHLAVAHADTRATLAAVARRAEGASPDDLLLAAIALLRDQAARIAGLENEVGFLSDEKDRVEGERDELAGELTELGQEIGRLVPTEHMET